MRKDFGTRPYKSMFPYSKDTKGKRVKAKQATMLEKMNTLVLV